MCQYIDHRRYKKVMRYHADVRYGNDLLERPVDAWDESTMESYAEFVRPLMPTETEPKG